MAYTGLNSSTDWDTIPALGHQDSLELNQRGRSCWWNPFLSPKRSLDMEHWLPFFFLLLPMEYVWHSGLWETWWCLAPQTPHLPTHHPAGCRRAAVVSRIRELKWQNGSDLELEGPCNLPQPSRHYGKVTWKIKCREVSQNIGVLFEAQ